MTSTTVEDAVATADHPAVGRIRTVARLLDERVKLPVVGVRVGLDSILGLLPVGGDVAGGLLSLYIVLEGVRLGVSRWTLFRMLVNIALDVGLGSVPLAGDVFDVFWKANSRNVDLVVADLDGSA